jgi:hypothetical protein
VRIVWINIKNREEFQKYINMKKNLMKLWEKKSENV